MPIRIIKKTKTPAAEEPTEAPIVKPKTLGIAPSAADSREASLNYWKTKAPPINAKPHPCPYCDKIYRMPCSESEKDGCQNYRYKIGKI